MEAGASYQSSMDTSKSAKNALSNQQGVQAQQQANFNLVQTQEAPYRELGAKNIGSLQEMLAGGYDMKESPSAKYAMSKGTDAINSNLQARGLEGHAVQQLGELASNTAASDYSNRFNQLLAATNIGSNAVAMTGSGVNSLNSNLQSGSANAGSIMMGAANSNASNMGAAAGQMSTIGSGILGNYSKSSSWGGSDAMRSAYVDNSSYPVIE